MIKLEYNKKLKVLKKVKIKDNCWNMPGVGYLNPGSIVQVNSSPTRISDVPFIVLEGTGQITHRSPSGETKKPIESGSKGFFFLQGHKTVCPYDYGTLEKEFFQESN